MSDQVKQIAMRISDLREISDYTVERMAAALDVPVEEYKKIESGAIDIPISFLVKVGETFHMTRPFKTALARVSRVSISNSYSRKATIRISTISVILGRLNMFHRTFWICSQSVCIRSQPHFL